MTTGEITVQDLEQLLRGYGFRAGSRLGNSRRFVNKHAGATILLPLDPPASARPIYVGNVRTHLDQLGLLGREDFDEWMWRLRIARKDGKGARRQPLGNGSGAPDDNGKGRRRANGSSPAAVASGSRRAPRTSRTLRKNSA